MTLIGRLTADPELRFTPSGAPVANFTIVTDRRQKNSSDEWESVDSTFWRCSVWRDQAENVAESLTRGLLVIASGRVKQRQYETAEGEKRTTFEVDVDHIGPSLKGGPATVRKTDRTPPQNDPWNLTSGNGDNPPF